MNRIVSGILLILLFVNMFTIAIHIHPVKAYSGTIFINADGSITPPTAPIYTADNITYTLTGNITSSSNGIVIERDNIVLNGAGYTLQGPTNHYGITLSERSNVAIENIEISNFYYGISFCSVSNSTISENKITKNGYGIALSSSTNYTNISENYVSSNNFDGIELFETSNYNSISGNSITTNYHNGISLSSSNNTIAENNLTANGWFGISGYYSSYNSISENSITNNGDGISLSISSNDNVISENNITSNFQNIWVDSSSNNTISGNNIVGEDTISYLELGIILVSSNFTSISGNTFTNSSLFVWDSYQSSVENNTVNGEPLVYLEDLSNYTVDDAGQVVLVNCENITVEALNLSRTDCGIELWETNKSTISGNNITTSNEYGIYLESSLNNCISGNNITNNVNGVYLYSCSNNSICGNNITNNVQGVWVGSSSNNSIFHNNFVNNIRQVYSINSVNTWDDGHIRGGNYWSNYNGTDSNHDGVGDSPYVIDSNNTDNYPLMSQYTHIVGDMNGDGKVGLADLGLLASAYNSRIGDPNWNSLADIAPPYGIIGLTDLVTLAMNYGQHSP